MKKDEKIFQQDLSQKESPGYDASTNERSVCNAG